MMWWFGWKNQSEDLLLLLSYCLFGGLLWKGGRKYFLFEFVESNFQLFMFGSLN